MILLHTLLLTICYFVFFKDVISDFKKERKLASLQSQKMDFVKPPAITLCPEIGLKPSMKKELGITSESPKTLFGSPRNMSRFTSLMEDLTPFQLFEKITYNLGSDWIITSSNDFKIKSIITLDKGACILALPRQEIKGTDELSLTLKIGENLQKEDVPTHIQVFISSNKTWQRVIANTWDTYIPKTLNVALSESSKQLTTVLQITKNQWYYGSDECIDDCEFKECFRADHILDQRGDCDPRCIPFVLKDFFPDENVTICDSFKDHYCNWKMPNNLLESKLGCLDSKRSTYFTGYSFSNDAENTSDTKGITLKFIFNKYKRFHEEVLMYDFKTLLGNVGGALGLFIGFSLYDSTLRIFTCILEKCKY